MAINEEFTYFFLLRLSRVLRIQLLLSVASRALYFDQSACPLQAGNPGTKVYPCMVAVMADSKTAGELHARLTGNP